MRKTLPLKKMSTRIKLLAVSMATVITISGGTQVNAQHSYHDHYDQLPDLGSTAARYLSEGDAKTLGRAFIRQSRFRLPYVSDPELVKYINELGDRLLAVSDDAGKPYDFHLIKNQAINAFAVPGGQIAIHTGILTKSESESELASVIAHEISHVTQRHLSLIHI